MNYNIVIAGSGFAGMWAAASASRAISLANAEDRINVTVVSPSASMVIRPRLYEAVLENVAPDLKPLFSALGVRHLVGSITEIDVAEHRLVISGGDGVPSVLNYDKFVLATGSRLFTPPVPGLAEHAFSVDQLADAQALDSHLKSLASQPASPARDTAVIVGGGFTGIETAAEMPDRLRSVLGEDAKIRVVIVEQAATVGPELGAVPRPVIEAALAECGVEIVTMASVATIDAEGIILSSGQRIDANTVVWTAGARANPLTAQIPGEKDSFGRIAANPFLHANGVSDVFVTGDVASVATDTQGNLALMSCQHALSLGRVAGHNAAAELLGLPLHPYSQPKYVTCLDLGPWGALYTEGWDRQVKLTRNEAKSLKRDITTKWIYPPVADREAVFAVANPDYVIVP